MNKELLEKLTSDYGDAFYILDSAQFESNFRELKKAFSAIYENFNIAYSYKTNYTPKLCKLIDKLGGYAEVVSDMEMEIALRVGVVPEKIIWNGPYKNYKKVEELLLIGGTVNLDSVYEIEKIKDIAKRFPKHNINIGIRVNFDIDDGVTSRFGFDVETEDFKKVLRLVKEAENINLIGVQCHFATRRLETWRPRAEKMLALLDGLNLTPDHIDLGGGLFGKMDETLKAQFDSEIPSYEEYANAVAPLFAEHFKNRSNKPLLLIEPGSALVGDCMKFACKVVNIKEVRGKAIATLLGSIYNINPTLNKKNPPIKVYSMGKAQKEYKDLDFGGFTCIESDYLYRHFNGKLAQGDIVVFGNAGSYSVVLKPPFILPNFPVIEITENGVELIKRGEVFDDLFHTFAF
ncbi:MAG: alanine racemase [Prevotella sp.]|nr:alanine racemase [Prevotella sp.]